MTPCDVYQDQRGVFALEFVLPTGFTRVQVRQRDPSEVSCRRFLVPLPPGEVTAICVQQALQSILAQLGGAA